MEIKIETAIIYWHPMDIKRRSENGGNWEHITVFNWNLFCFNFVFSRRTVAWFSCTFIHIHISYECAIKYSTATSVISQSHVYGLSKSIQNCVNCGKCLMFAMRLLNFFTVSEITIIKHCPSIKVRKIIIKLNKTWFFTNFNSLVQSFTLKVKCKSVIIERLLLLLVIPRAIHFFSLLFFTAKNLWKVVFSLFQVF